MKRLSSLIPILLLSLATAALAQPVTPPLPPADRSVTLITIGPGAEVWEKFGHNLIWVHDPDAVDPREIDLCWNWGIFDFEQPNFIGNFVRGRMTYQMAGWPIGNALAEYQTAGRHVLFQRLPLTPEQIADLIARCKTNRLPENREYRYDYFNDNCSTRVRDMLDGVTGGKIKALIDARPPSPPMTFRRHTVRLTQDDLLISTGMDFLMGPAGDRVLSGWEEAFLPTSLSDDLKPWATRSWSPWTSTRPSEPTTVPDRTLPMAAIGLGGAAVITAAALARRRLFRVIAYLLTGAWWLIAGIGGAFMVFMWCTDHVAAHLNQNLLHYSPLDLFLLLMLIVLPILKRIKIRDATSRDRQGVRASTPVTNAGCHGSVPQAVDRSTCQSTTASASQPRLGVPSRGTRKAGHRATTLRWGTFVLLAISSIGLLGKGVGLLSQQNWQFILLAFPLNAAAALAAWRLTARPRADEVPVL